MRAFLAVAVAPPALSVVDEALAELSSDVPAVRWVRPATVHITLRFFASLAEGDVTAVMTAAGKAAESMAPFDVQLGRFGSFNDHGVPRVLWIGVDTGAAQLHALAAQCDAALIAAGFDAETRPFRAHCTIGRPRPPWPYDARRAWRAAVAPAFPAFACDRITLFESVPGRGGSVYTVRGVAPFAAML